MVVRGGGGGGRRSRGSSPANGNTPRTAAERGGADSSGVSRTAAETLTSKKKKKSKRAVKRFVAWAGQRRQRQRRRCQRAHRRHAVASGAVSTAATAGERRQRPLSCPPALPAAAETPLRTFPSCTRGPYENRRGAPNHWAISAMLLVEYPPLRVHMHIQGQSHQRTDPRPSSSPTPVWRAHRRRQLGSFSAARVGHSPHRPPPSARPRTTRYSSGG